MRKLEFYPSIFIPEESNSMASQLVILVEASGTTDETMLLAKEALKESNIKLTNVLNAQKTNPFTELLKSEDFWRDETHIGGRDWAAAMTHWVFDTEKQEAAIRLVEIFERHGWSLQSFGYQKQSSATNSFIAELKKPENQKDLATCNMLDWFNAEINAQSKFETVFNEKTGHEARKQSTAKREAQVTVNIDIENLVTYLNSVILFKKQEECLVVHM